MPSRLIAHLDYQLYPSITEDKPESEGHKQKALLGLEHMTGLGHLLRCVEIDWEAAPDVLAQRIDDANAGIQAAAELLVLLGDLVYDEVELLDDLHLAMIAYLKGEETQQEASGEAQARHC